MERDFVGLAVKNETPDEINDSDLQLSGVVGHFERKMKRARWKSKSVSGRDGNEKIHKQKDCSRICLWIILFILMEAPRMICHLYWNLAKAPQEEPIEHQLKMYWHHGM